MRRNFWKWVLLGFCSMNINAAVAAGVFVGKTATVWVNDGTTENIGWIEPQGAISNSSCSLTNYFVVDLSKPDKMMALTFALSAHMAGKEVRLGGTGACLGGKYECLKYIEVR